MEEKVFKPIINKGIWGLIILFAVFFLGMLAFAILQIIMVAPDSINSFNPLIRLSVVWLFISTRSLSRIFVRRIVFSDCIKVERFIFGPKMLSYADIQYFEGKILVCQGYTIYADNFSNAGELFDCLNEYSARGLFELQPKSAEQARKDKINFRLILIGLILSAIATIVLIAFVDQTFIKESIFFIFLLIAMCIHIIAYRNRNLFR